MKQSNLFQDNTNEENFIINEKLLYKKRSNPIINNIKISQKHGRNSLDFIAKEVFNYILSSGKEYINLNEIANIIKMPKRRLYDVTNVLEGK